NAPEAIGAAVGRGWPMQLTKHTKLTSTRHTRRRSSFSCLSSAFAFFVVIASAAPRDRWLLGHARYRARIAREAGRGRSAEGTAAHRRERRCPARLHADASSKATKTQNCGLRIADCGFISD